MLIRFVLLAVLSFQMSPVLAQSSFKEKLVARNVRNLVDTISTLENPEGPRNEWDNLQMVVPHYTSGSIEFTTWEKEGESSWRSQSKVSIQFIALDSTIFYWKLTETRRQKTTTDSFADDLRLKQFKDKFYSAYKQPVNMEELLEPQRAFSDQGCGEAGSRTREWIDMENKVGRREIES
jgi:hypothetical protein